LSAQGEQPTAGQPGGRAPSEEELRAAYEQELSRITATDMMAQAAVSLLNVGALRLGAPGSGEQGAAGPERDLEQARDAIDGARALVGILERRIPQELGPIRAALSQLQMAYAREVQTGAGESQPPPAGAEASGIPAGADTQGGGGAPGQPPAQDEQHPPGPGPAESSGRLWVPGR
jgi:hypothetical protein